MVLGKVGLLFLKSKILKMKLNLNWKRKRKNKTQEKTNIVDQILFFFSLLCFLCVCFKYEKIVKSHVLCRTKDVLFQWLFLKHLKTTTCCRIKWFLNWIKFTHTMLCLQANKHTCIHQENAIHGKTLLTDSHVGSRPSYRKVCFVLENYRLRNQWIRLIMRPPHIHTAGYR